jgi:hypothetical protein
VGRVLLVCCNLHGLIVESKQNPGTSDVLQCRKRFGGDDDMSYQVVLCKWSRPGFFFNSVCDRQRQSFTSSFLIYKYRSLGTASLSIYSQASWLSYLLSFSSVHWVHLYGSEEGACPEI